MKQVLHKHHIIPKHAGGTDDPSNLVVLTIAEHAEAHRKLYEEYNRQEDYLAWKGLDGSIGKDALILAKCSLNSSRPGELNTFFGKRHTEETKRIISEKKKGHSYNKGILKSAEHRQKLKEIRVSRIQQYKFEHKDGRFFIGSTAELSKMVGSHPAESWKLVVGQYKTHKGWKMIDKI